MFFTPPVREVGLVQSAANSPPRSDCVQTRKHQRRLGPASSQAPSHCEQDSARLQQRPAPGPSLFLDTPPREYCTPHGIATVSPCPHPLWYAPRSRDPRLAAASEVHPAQTPIICASNSFWRHRRSRRASVLRRLEAACSPHTFPSDGSTSHEAERAADCPPNDSTKEPSSPDKNDPTRSAPHPHLSTPSASHVSAWEPSSTAGKRSHRQKMKVCAHHGAKHRVPNHPFRDRRHASTQIRHLTAE